MFLKYKRLRVPWKAVLGNHDYEGTPEAEVLFTESAKNASLGSCWQMPSINHTFDVAIESTTPSGGLRSTSVSMFGLDTSACQ